MNVAVQPPPLVALTGGIGSGKSEACKIFSELGIPVVDLDHIAHAISVPGTAAMQAVRACFGDDYFTAEGQLDRAKLRALVFEDAQALQQLNDIMHPAIRTEALTQIAQYTQQPYVVLAIPLLVESQADWPMIRHVLVIDCSEDMQIARVMARNQLSQRMAEAMLAAQSPREARLRIADTVIDNSGNLAELKQKVLDFHKKMLKTCT